MPSSTHRLRDKFMTRTDDGRAKCEKLITDNGGTVHRGLISYTGNDSEVFDAVQYLIEE
jgi:hypothetical protein